MNNDANRGARLREWLEIIGIFTVVVSLVFVGLEMRQSREIALSQTYQSRVAAVVEWNTAFGQPGGPVGAAQGGEGETGIPEGFCCAGAGN